MNVNNTTPWIEDVEWKIEGFSRQNRVDQFSDTRLTYQFYSRSFFRLNEEISEREKEAEEANKKMIHSALSKCS